MPREQLLLRCPLQLFIVGGDVAGKAPTYFKKPNDHTPRQKLRNHVPPSVGILSCTYQKAT